MNYSIANYSVAPVSYSVPVVKATWSAEVILGAEHHVFANTSLVRQAFLDATQALSLEAGSKALHDCIDLLKSSDIARSKHNVDEISASISNNVNMLVLFANAQIGTLAKTAEQINKVKIDTLVSLDRYLQALEVLF
jgi:hypothetical protein